MGRILSRPGTSLCQQDKHWCCECSPIILNTEGTQHMCSGGQQQGTGKYVMLLCQCYTHAKTQWTQELDINSRTSHLIQSYSSWHTLTADENASPGVPSLRSCATPFLRACSAFNAFACCKAAVLAAVILSSAWACFSRPVGGFPE